VHLNVGTVVADRFQLVRKLGEGGMGSVWLSHHVKLDTPCAVKFIHAEVASAAGVKERFEREAKVAAQIRSPHVVQVLDYGVSEGVPYIAMEYLDGEDLAARLATRGRLSPAETVAIVGQIARALTKAHAAGLVHRDLKPENVFLVRDDDHELVKVLDFGIAKAQAPLLDGNTRTGTMLGTPRYMSPEQAQGVKAVDHRSDLWSLGIITYRSVVGHLPFDSDALGDLLMRIMVHPMPVPSTILPGLPPAFDAWWTRAAARDPAQRFQSAKELSEALGAALGVAMPISGPAGMGPIGGPTPPAVAGHSPVPFAAGGSTPPPPLGLHGHTAHGGPPPGLNPTLGSAPSATHLSGPSHAAFTPPPYARGATPYNSPSSPPMPTIEQTMSPASRTYGTGAPRKRSGAWIALAGVIAAGAVAFGVGLFMLRSKPSDGPAGGDPAPPSPSVTAAVTATAAPTVEPASVAPEPPPTGAPSTAAQPPLSVKPIARPKVQIPPASPTPPAAPTRTGKVKLAPPGP